MRRNRKGHHKLISAQDDTFEDFTREALQPVRPASPVADATHRVLSGLSDRRLWAPRLPGEPDRAPARDFAGRPARTVYRAKAPTVRRGPGGKPLRSKQNVFSVRHFVEHHRFAQPARVYICLQRKIRQEVLHALKRTKSGRGSPRRKNEFSNVRC